MAENTKSKEDALKAKRLVMLKNSYWMYETTKNETIKKRNETVDKHGVRVYSEESLDETLELMNTMQEDIRKQYIEAGGDEAELLSKPKKKRDRTHLEELVKRESQRDEMAEYINQLNDVSEKKEKDIKTDNEVEYTTYKEEEEKQLIFDEPDKEVLINIDKNIQSGNKVQFDAVPLPSKGEGYKNKIDKIPVGYLTAYDENMIVSPNLYHDGTFLDVLLKTKIMNSKIDAEDLLTGDRDAIILWLRASSYGPEFPVTATDNETGKKFDTIIDLSKIKYKKFNLKGDNDGYFDYELPVSHDKIKFKFLTTRDIKKLEKLEEVDNKGILKENVTNLKYQLDSYIENDDKLEGDLLKGLKDASNSINKYIESIDVNPKSYNKTITNKMIMSIMSINDITDRRYINEYVNYMNVRDAAAFRKYVNENEPGLDFNITIEKPESLGGGSMTMFLSFDQYLFLNII